MIVFANSKGKYVKNLDNYFNLFKIYIVLEGKWKEF